MANDSQPIKPQDSDENRTKVKVLFDFSDAQAIDDRVIGSVSPSKLRHDPAGHAVFEGEVSLERNGGFASMRCQAAPLGMQGAVDGVIEARGDGKHFNLSLFIDDAFDALRYQAEFTPAANAWGTIRLPISTFVATFREREVPGAPALDPARIRQIGLMIAGEQAGLFALDVRSIRLE